MPLCISTNKVQEITKYSKHWDSTCSTNCTCLIEHERSDAPQRMFAACTTYSLLEINTRPQSDYNSMNCLHRSYPVASLLNQSARHHSLAEFPSNCSRTMSRTNVIRTTKRSCITVYHIYNSCTRTPRAGDYGACGMHHSEVRGGDREGFIPSNE